jgi:hypothetical protein
MAPYLSLVLLLTLASCSLTKLALRSQAPLFEKGGDTLKHEKDWHWFREATPGNIQFMETMLSQDDDNHVLRRTLVKAYAGYAYGVFETLMIPELLEGSDEKPQVQRALGLYQRAMGHGRKYFAHKDVNFDVQDEADFVESLRDNVDEEDLVALAFHAQAWAGMINLQKQDMVLVSQLPRVKLVFDHVCGLKPDIENGLCPLFYAQYEASRPRMLGGNPELARELFQKFMQKSPAHLLARVSYLQFSVIPRLDEDEFVKVGRELDEAIAKWKVEQGNENLNLLNAIGQERWALLKKNQKKIF